MDSPKRLLLSTAVAFTMGRSRTPGCDMAGRDFDCAGDYGVPVPRMDGSRTSANIQAAALTPGSIVIDQCPSRITAAARLLAGANPTGAEKAGIEQWDIEPNRNGCLSWKAIPSTILRGSLESEGTPDDSSIGLRTELLLVLRLSTRLRQCFVLRVLMAMPRQYCADLLRIDAREVDANSRMAARELASMV